MSTKTRKHVRMSLSLFVAVMTAVFVVGMATAALADMHLPSSPIGQRPVFVRITATPLPVRTANPSTPAPARPTIPAQGRCGGSLPSCQVMKCESGGNLRVRNISGSSASGKWQFLRSTWNGFGGYAEARDAPESVQDAKARQLWAGGAGASHWRSCL